MVGTWDKAGMMTTRVDEVSDDVPFTLLTLVMFPVLVWMYSHLAIHEEREIACRFGDAWQAYTARTPRYSAAPGRWSLVAGWRL